jgi:N utilization substance protein B
MASRRKGRILAFQALYSWDAACNASAGKRPGQRAEKGREKKAPAPENPPPVSEIPGELLDFAWLESDKRANLDEGISTFSRLLIVGTIENIAAVDAMIRSHLQNWDFSRLNRVDLAILRMSAYTLMFQTDVAPSIVINEAIGISKEFGTDDSYRFINGVLDNIRRTLQEQGSAPEKERICPRA